MRTKRETKRRKRRMRGAAVSGLLFLFCIAGVWIFFVRKRIPADFEKVRVMAGGRHQGEEEHSRDVFQEKQFKGGETIEGIQTRSDEILAGMSMEEKVSQLFMITPEALTGVGTVTAAGNITRAALVKHPVGGIIYFEENLIDEGQTKEMLEAIQGYCREITGLPLLLGIDEEGGSVVRISGRESFPSAPKIPDMSVIGSNGNEEEAKEIGTSMGTYLKALGFNLDFAPVADVLTNEENTVIKKRSFGADAGLVSVMSEAVRIGLEEQGVYGCLKHFPGHGATAGDTHNGYAYSDRTIEELHEKELQPFKTGISNGVDFIMVGHIAVPNVTGDETPASLSYEIVTGLLKENLGYNGIIITDALNMGAIVKEYSSAEASVKAIQAGVDMLLMPEDFTLAYQRILEAVSSGEISEERLNESVKKIIMAKLKMEEQE